MSEKQNNVFSFIKEAPGLLLMLEEERSKSLANTGVTSYVQLGFLIQSLIAACQKSLFVEEINNDKDVKIDIYNLLCLVKELLPHNEFELLDLMLKKEE